MQLVSRYLLSNNTVVVTDDTGNLTEYRKVYQRNIKIAKGIDNVITFEIKNHDQKPVSILNTYTPYVEVFTEDNVLLKKYVGTIKETTTPSFKGQFTINITDGDTINLDAQYLSYTVYLTNTSDTNTLTYADSQYGIKGTIELTNEAFPGAISSKSITTCNNLNPPIIANIKAKMEIISINRPFRNPITVPKSKGISNKISKVFN